MIIIPTLILIILVTIVIKNKMANNRNSEDYKNETNNKNSQKITLAQS